MKRVQLLTSMAGQGFNHESGESIDLPDSDAARFIERGLAVAEIEKSVSPIAKFRETRKNRN